MRRLIFLIAAGIAHAQPGPGSAEYRAPLARAPVRNLPFIAEFTVTPPDPRTPVRVLRDAQGRTRSEHALVEIDDPARGVFLVLEPARKIAHRIRYETAGALPGGITVSGRLITPPTNAPAPPRPETREEALGVQTILGLTAEGRRVTTTYPPYAAGNDRAFSTVVEEWRSPLLQLILRSVTRDPRGPERVRAVAKLARAAPDPALFEIPPGYRAVEEPGPFRVELPRAAR